MPLCSGSIPIAVDHVRRDLGLVVVAPRPTDPGELFDDVGGVLHLRRVCEIAALLRTHPPEPPYAVSKLPSSSSPLVDPHRLQLGDKLIELAITEPSGLAIELAAFDKLE